MTDVDKVSNSLKMDDKEKSSQMNDESFLRIN